MGLGPGSIIYYDMESYSQGVSSCQSAVVSFLTGWASKLVSLKYVPGLYTSTGAAEADWASLASEIPDVIVGKHDVRATIWGLDCSPASCAASYGLVDTTWGEGYRGHQCLEYANAAPPGNYTGGEDYGGVAFDCPGTCIDRDIEWAQVDGGNGSKSYTYSSSDELQLNCLALALNDSGMGSLSDSPTEAAGQCQPSSGITGFYFNSSVSPAQQVSFVYPGSTGGTFAYGINDQGNSQGGSEVVGGYEPDTSGSTEYGFIVPSGGVQSGAGFQQFAYPSEPFTWLVGINGDDQLVGRTREGASCPFGAFFYDRVSNSFSSIEDSNALTGSYVNVAGVNGFGQVAGWYEDKRGNDHGFIWDWAQQTVTQTIDLNPGGCEKGTIRLTGINNNEQVTFYCETAPGSFPGFLYDFFHGTAPMQLPVTGGGMNDIPDAAQNQIALPTPQ